MRALALMLVIGTASAAEAPPRAVSLHDAVELALRTDPLVEAAYVDRDRTKNATLRSQLDRITFRIDGSLQELWNKYNIGGANLGGVCAVQVEGQTVQVPVGTAASCNTQNGMYQAIPDSGGQGLLNLTAQLNVPVFSGFRVEATVKRQQAIQEAAIVTLRRVRRDTALAAARTFWQVRRLQLLAEVNRGAVTRLADAESVANGRVKAGLAPPIDRNRATVRRLQQTSQVLEYEGQIKESLSQLGVVLGLKDAFDLTGDFTFPDRIPRDPRELVETARHDRAELPFAKLQIDAAKQSVRIAQADFYPQLTGIGLFQYGNNQLSIGTGARSISSAANPFTNVTGSLTVGGSLGMNFFNMLTTWTNQKDAKYEVARLETERRRAERAVDSDVVSAHARCERLYSKRAPLRESVELARDNVHILESRYKSGDALVIELLDAQVELTNAEASLVDVEAQLEQAWLELRASMGEVPGGT